MSEKEYFVTAAEAEQMDRHTIEHIGIPQLVLMEKAAEGVAKAALDLLKERDKCAKILVLCEGGNNGADGIAAARILKKKGFVNTKVLYLAQIPKVSEAFHKQVDIARAFGVEILSLEKDGDISNYIPVIRQADLVIDAIFGVGLKREVRGVHKEIIEAVNQGKQEGEGKLLAVDIASGIDSTTGECLGCAIRADVTVTFGFCKYGMLFGEGRDRSGEVICHDICLLPEKEPVHMTYTKRMIQERLPGRKQESNKGTYGKVLVCAGAKNMCGAAIFSATAAYRMGVGLVQVLTVEENREIIQQVLPEAILKTWKGVEEDSNEERAGRVDQQEIRSAVQWANVIVAGPGLGKDPEVKNLLSVLFHEGNKAGKTLILDADALNWIAEDEELAEKIRHYQGDKIMTPHMGEAKRLFESCCGKSEVSIRELKKCRDEVAKSLSRYYDSIVLLKDARSIAAAPGQEEIYVNTFGNSGMAKGGSGDVLTGIVAALYALGLDSLASARIGCSLHALCGDEAAGAVGEAGLMATDLIRAISTFMK